MYINGTGDNIYEFYIELNRSLNFEARSLTSTNQLDRLLFRSFAENLFFSSYVQGRRKDFDAREAHEFFSAPSQIGKSSQV